MLDELMSRLLAAHDTYTSQIAVEVKEEEEREARDAVKREQDIAFQMSLEVRVFILFSHIGFWTTKVTFCFRLIGKRQLRKRRKKPSGWPKSLRRSGRRKRRTK